MLQYELAVGLHLRIALPTHMHQCTAPPSFPITYYRVLLFDNRKALAFYEFEHRIGVCPQTATTYVGRPGCEEKYGERPRNKKYGPILS